MARIIFKKDLPLLLEMLAKKYRVIAPIKKEGHPSFDSISFKEFEPGDPLALPYGTTILPPKEFTLPPKETLFHFLENEPKKPIYPAMAFFGVSAEDLEGIERLDKVMAEPVLDEPYVERRKKMILIGLDHFSPPKEGFDLYLMWLNSETLAGFAKTKKGREILSSKFFKEQPARLPKVKRGKDELLSHPKLAKAIESSRNHPVWKTLSEKCLGCGICSYVCPLCYCFDVQDEVPHLNKNQGSRCRNWDSCLLANFSDTAAGNFRPELWERLYNWYFHKFVRMEKEYGFPGCVGCNRCTIYCPAKINYRSVLKEVLNDYLKKEKLREKPQLHTKAR